MPLIESSSATAAFIAPVIEAVTVSFDSMFGASVRMTAFGPRSSERMFEVSSIIGFAGDCSGSLCVSAPRETLLCTISRALKHDGVKDVNRLCRDSLNELSNVVAGYTKDRMIELNLKLGLPTAVQGCDVAINYPKNAEPVRIDFESDFGRLMVVIGLVRRTTGDAA